MFEAMDGDGQVEKKAVWESPRFKCEIAPNFWKVNPNLETINSGSNELFLLISIAKS